MARAGAEVDNIEVERDQLRPLHDTMTDLYDDVSSTMWDAATQFEDIPPARRTPPSTSSPRRGLRAPGERRQVAAAGRTQRLD